MRETLERLDSVIDFLISINSQKPLNALNDEELQEVLNNLGVHRIKIDRITIKSKLGRMSELLNHTHS
ncbi:MAG: hypothetical protein VB084_10290 [Syntrophomonadaceae bacterium]|nr:hypothetical protein [Syntrophomonadaceae bacterium]